jgi:hypothetical protein
MGMVTGEGSGPLDPPTRVGSAPFSFFVTAWLSVRGAAAAPLRMQPPHINHEK